MSRLRSLAIARNSIKTAIADDINTWSYRRGIQDGWIPPDIANTSQLVFPLLANGCVNSSFEYTAPSSPEPQFGGGRPTIELAAWTLLLTAIACIEVTL